jgi:hypothetical protein
MKRGFLIANGIALFFALVSVGWIIYDFFAFGIIRSKMRLLLPLTPADEKLANLVWLGLVVFLLSHIVSFIAGASQFHHFRKASVLRILALILGVISCVMILADFACMSDIGNDYEKGRVAELEFRVLYRIAAIRGIIFFAIIANLIEAFVQGRRRLPEEKVAKDEVILTLVHSVGVFCGLAGLFFANAAFLTRLAHPLLHFTFPFLFVLTLIPYALLAGYWLVTKLKEKPAGWYDEKEFQALSKAGLLSMVATVPFLAMIYILTYNAYRSPIGILWFPFYLYFVMLVFSLSSLYFSWRD